MNAHTDLTGRRRMSRRYRRELRAQAEEAIERLLSLLDDLDGDPDLEDGGDTEPNGDEHDSSMADDECASWSCDDLVIGRRARQRETVKFLEMDRAGNVSMMRNGVRWIGGRLKI